MASIDRLRAWFERDLRFATWDENVLVNDPRSGKIEIRLYTDTNEYTLVLVDKGDDTSSIDATVRSRKPRAGQQTARVRHLFAEGRYLLNEQTWRRILGCIVGLELVRVQRRDPGERAGALSENDKWALPVATRATPAGLASPVVSSRLPAPIGRSFAPSASGLERRRCSENLPRRHDKQAGI
jgi:hypothetical protein